MRQGLFLKLTGASYSITSDTKLHKWVIVVVSR